MAYINTDAAIGSNKAVSATLMEKGFKAKNYLMKEADKNARGSLETIFKGMSDNRAMRYMHQRLKRVGGTPTAPVQGIPSNWKTLSGILSHQGTVHPTSIGQLGSKMKMGYGISLKNELAASTFKPIQQARFYQNLMKKGGSKFASRALRAGAKISPVAIGLGIGLLAAGGMALSSLSKSINWKGQSKYRRVATASGPGYISWGKTRGMPANHLGTDNLPQALSNMRHGSMF